MYPKNQYSSFIEKKIKKLNLNNIRTFAYSPNPEVLTGEIEILTNYSQRKRSLELRKKMFEDKDDEQSRNELTRLDQLYTLGEVNFDSVIIIDFGNNLKSVLTSLVYADVDQNKVLFTTINQWFDESIFYENTIKNLYYPSINYREFKKYNQKYFEKFKSYPTEITILTYDALGLIYYAWKTSGQVKSPKILFEIFPCSLPSTEIILPSLPLNERLLTKVADLFFLFSSFFKMNFIALKKLPFFFASLAECMPGLFPRAFIHKPESSDTTG